MRNKNTTTVIWVGLVLVCATGLGYGIRQIRWSLAMRENLSESERRAQVLDSEPKAETVPDPESEVEGVDINTTTIEEPILEELEDQSQPQPSEEPILEEPEDQSQLQPSQEARNSGPTTQGLGDLRRVWADLNLTQEEQARLREGWRLAVARWQNMSEEERQWQAERRRASWEKWQNMSDVEREQASLELRQRIEDWRQSGTTELPDMILD